jgi:hypothetical protein
MSFWKKKNPKFNLMNFKFEFVNFHINHLAQLGMINITLKCQEKNIYKKVHSFHHYSTWFWLLFLYLHPIMCYFFPLFINLVYCLHKHLATFLGSFFHALINWRIMFLTPLLPIDQIIVLQTPLFIDLGVF